jgi:hypothetical protein
MADQSLSVRLFGTPEEREVRKLLRKAKRQARREERERQWLADAPRREAEAKRKAAEKVAEWERTKRGLWWMGGIGVACVIAISIANRNDRARHALEEALHREPEGCVERRRMVHAFCPRVKDECDEAIALLRLGRCVELTEKQRRLYDEGWAE